MEKIKIGILGVTGYTGRELVRILSSHPQGKVTYLGTSSAQGKTYADIYPETGGTYIGKLTLTDEREIPELDVLFCALPHGLTAARAPDLLARSAKVIDLGADFRLRNSADYELWYKIVHPTPALIEEAAYGIPELYRDRLRPKRLIANPGCYPTASLLALVPLLEGGLITADLIVIDAKSGVSGAGRTATPGVHFSEVDSGVKAYGVEGHRHVPEIEQALVEAGGQPVRISFTPHLIPMIRGMMTTIYVKTKEGVEEGDIRACWQKAYAEEPFIHLLPEGIWPSTKFSLGSNNAFLQVHLDRRTGRATVNATLDNLMKGASGQAVQNMNLICGLPETLGLEYLGLWP